MTAAFVEALPETTRAVLRVGGSGDGYGDSGLELKLETWERMFRPTRFRDGWIDFGFGQESIIAPDPAFTEAVDAFVAHQAKLAASIPPIAFLSIPMLRDCFVGFPTEAVFERLKTSDDLFGALHPYAIHANRVGQATYAMGAFFFSDWDDNIGLGFLFHDGRMIAAGEAQLAETTWMAREAFEGTLTLDNAYWLPPR